MIGGESSFSLNTENVQRIVIKSLATKRFYNEIIELDARNQFSLLWLETLIDLSGDGDLEMVRS